jgi:hypothetical protein
MAQRQPWYRFYNETTEDEKLDAASEMTGAAYDTVLATWVILMMYAKISPVEGCLLIAVGIPLPVARIAKKLRRPDHLELVEKILLAFHDLDMLTTADGVTKITHWSERQYVSDSSTPRVQKHRAGKGGNVSPDKSGNVSYPEGGNTPESETEAETDTEPENIEGEDQAPPRYEGKYINEYEAESIYRKVTGFMSIPSLSRENAIRLICDIAYKKGSDTDKYLKPYYMEWINPLRKRENGMPYSKTGIGWLDWAAVEQIPPLEAPKTPRSPNEKPTSPPTVDPRKAALQEMRREAQNGRT